MLRLLFLHQINVSSNFSDERLVREGGLGKWVSTSKKLSCQNGARVDKSVETAK